MNNQLLALLPAADKARWLPLLKHVELKQGQSLYVSGQALNYVYFPMGSIVALHGMSQSGLMSELALVGREGLVGIVSFLGGGSSTNDAVVLSSGPALRMGALALRHEFESSNAVMYLMLRYTQALISQMAQTALCNQYHSVDQAMSRLLLLGLDCVQSSELSLTQGWIAQILGLRRERVSEAAVRLQRRGLIHYSRGRIVVPDRSALQHVSCECYAAIKKEYERLLPPNWAP
ncbi:Crp/Fnr family transcriptional regulator [Limnohabitans sp. DM1]|uniref:Crp/Fnr family transcriptional regulator n=1 Tax=Limnohabitans sp. DM1 TaxID=1597955 RepID=UPI000B011401|nr:Crp/Fnr family transcriptional regulator [Limnohabitans sp. DM1]